MSTAAPSTSLDQGYAAVRQVLIEHYGLHPQQVARLGGEVDLNLVVACDERRVVVKIGPPDTDILRLRWQHELLVRLSVAEDVPPVPQILSTRDGRDVVLLSDGGLDRPVRVQTWLPGRTLADLNRHSPDLLREWGTTAARLVRSMPKSAPADRRASTHHWDVLRAADAVSSVLPAVRDTSQRADIETLLATFLRIVPGVADTLPHQVVHQDLNDFNVLASPDATGVHHVSGVLDFTDALYTARVSELAIAVAYAMLRKPDPISAAAQVISGYTALVPLTDDELRVLFPLAAARLCVNAATWTAREHDNGEYARERMVFTWPVLRRLATTSPTMVEHRFRIAAGDSSPGPARSVERALGGARGRMTSSALDGTGGHLRPGITDRRRNGWDGAPATVELGVQLAEVGVPPGGTVEVDTAEQVLVRYDEPSPFWARWIRQPDGSARLCLFTAADAARYAPRRLVTWLEAAAWHRICPDPRALFGMPVADAGTPHPSTPHPSTPDAGTPDPVALRERHVARSQRHYFTDPPVFTTSDDVWLYDEHGLGYLDAINNVSHVGHANRAVVSALATQAARLNTNSRFVYPELGEYAQRLAALLPDPLEVVFLVGSGSEANDLALRIVRQVTGRPDVAVIAGAYHGNTEAVTAISPNRYAGPGGAGRPPTTHELPDPDRYRGPYGYDDPTAGQRYAADAADVITSMTSVGRPPAAVFAESLLGSAGCILHPPGYLSGVFAAVRTAGGLCVSDEVQVGFGRLGDTFWGFETNDVVPDIVTMGKPIGNGHPLAAVVTTRAIADAFDTGMKYFNTFGGNPVSCAVGMAVLDEIERQDLQRCAQVVGAGFADRLRAVAAAHPMIGDVRGRGLYLGVELVRDRETLEPATAEAGILSELMKDAGVIVTATGTRGNVLKIKPPMTFARAHAEQFCDVLDQALSVDW